MLIYHLFCLINGFLFDIEHLLKFNNWCYLGYLVRAFNILCTRLLVWTHALTLSCIMRIDSFTDVIHIPDLLLKVLIDFHLCVQHFLIASLFFSLWLKLADKIPVLVQVIDDRVICEFMNACAHRQVFVNGDFEPAFHLLVIDSLTLTSDLFLVQIHYVLGFRASF